jgi:hypothetical protein
MPSCSEWSRFAKFSNQNFVIISILKFMTHKTTLNLTATTLPNHLVVVVIVGMG